MPRRRRMLGLVLEERTVLAAEVVFSHGQAHLRRTGEFPLSQGISLEEPEALGKALREDLHRHGFAARHAAVGVPARWVLAAEAVFPPADPERLAGMVRLDAERRFATDVKDLVVDYVDGTGPSGDGPGAEAPVLVAAMTRRRADQVRAAMRAAGLDLVALGPTSLVFGALARRPAPPTALLFLRAGHSEVLLSNGVQCRSLRHLALPEAALKSGGSQPSQGARAVADAVRRTLALHRAAGQTGMRPESVAIWNGANLPADFEEEIVAALGTRERRSLGLKDLGLLPSPVGAGADEDRFATAAALALAGARRWPLPIDFLHSRLETHRRSRYGRRLAWAVAAAAAVLLAVGAYAADWRRDERDLAEISARAAAARADMDSARALVERLVLARQWTDRRPRFLEPLRGLAFAFPDSGIWVTSLAIREDMRIAVHGKAADERAALELRDRLQARGEFQDVTLQYMRDAGTVSREWTFALVCQFVGKE